MNEIQEFDSRIQILAVIGAITLALIVIQLVRRRRLSEGYSMIWIGLSAIVLVLSLFRNLQEVVAHLVGVYYPPSLIFGTLIFILVGIMLYLCVVLTRLEARCCLLAQHLALLEQQILYEQRG
jgi:hypothetical protein